MTIQMAPISVTRIFLDSDIAEQIGDFEFTIDCGSIYFGAVYDGEGDLQAIDQYFYTESYSLDDLNKAAGNNQLLSVDVKDFQAKTYLLTKMDGEKEWLRFHAVVPQRVDTDYFCQKYIGK